MFCSVRRQAKLNFPFTDYLSVVFLLPMFTLEKLQGRFGIGIAQAEPKLTHETPERGQWQKGVSDHCS